MDDLFGVHNFNSVADEVIKNLFKHGHSSNEASAPLKKYIEDLLSSNNYEIDTVVEKLSDSSRNNENVQYFISKLKEHEVAILFSALNSYNSRYGNCITNYDWVLKAILGTNTLKNLRYPLMHINFLTLDSSGSQKVLYDVKKEQLRKLIESLETMYLESS